MGLLYLVGPTIQEVGGEIMMGLSIYRVAVIDGSLYSRFYGITYIASKLFQTQSVCTKTDFSIFITYFSIFLKPRRKRKLDLDFPVPWIRFSSLVAAEGVLETCWRS